MKKENGETINNRLKSVRKALGMTQVEIAEKLGIHGGSLSVIEAGRTDVTKQNIFLICTPNRLKDGLTVNENWLCTGKGRMFLEMPIPPLDERLEKLKAEEKELIEIMDKLFPDTQQEIINYAQEKLELQELRKKAGIREEKYPETKPLPQNTQDPAPPYVAATPETEGFDNVESIDYDMVDIIYLGDYAATAAGELREMLDDPGDREIRYLPKTKLKVNPKNCFCLPVRGTSMTEAGISDGDEVVLGLAEEPENGAIMLVSYDGQSTIKRVAVRNGKVFLQWEDGSGKEEEINKDGYRFLGKLLLILKSG